MYDYVKFDKEDMDIIGITINSIETNEKFPCKFFPLEKLPFSKDILSNKPFQITIKCVTRGEGYCSGHEYTYLFEIRKIQLSDSR